MIPSALLKLFRSDLLKAPEGISMYGNKECLEKGIGYAVVIIAFYVDFFYNVVIAWALYYFFASWTLNLPWVGCDNPWNTDDCFDGDPLKYDDYVYPTWANALGWIIAMSSVFMIPAMALYTLATTPGDTFLERLRTSITPLADQEAAARAVKNDQTEVRVVWFTAIFPYVVLMCLLIRGVTLPGSVKGIEYYLTPNFTKLGEPEVWVDAATQIFFSLGPGFGVLMAFASYNEFHNNVYHDAILTSCINCLTSFLSGFVIFAVLGYMSHRSGVSIKDVATEGPGLVFIVYPEAIATMPGSTAWAILFFLMLLTLGLDSSFGGSEAIITALSDEFVWVKKHREIFIGCLFTLYYCIGLTACAQLIHLFALPLFIKGVDRMSSDICEMIGTRPSAYWRTCWKFIAPPFILVSEILFDKIKEETPRYVDQIPLARPRGCCTTVKNRSGLKWRVSGGANGAAV
ncbi:PREDICTED: sodium-dependent dopamine transporter-like [Priapulus caudatus]|uniref:Sodium-dependent dopamine transporter-like n=1 Tax=Priapulus caudatus TaxID=37621 RepID=A0ABM1EMS3_PRICU|nr:PREDICTED: sodium-dependent dopamine transporter-like [Priapulus caudatus]